MDCNNLKEIKFNESIKYISYIHQPMNNLKFSVPKIKIDKIETENPKIAGKCFECDFHCSTTKTAKNFNLFFVSKKNHPITYTL